MAYTTIDKPTDYFNVKLYAGNSSTQSITGIGFQPDFVWIKRRNASAYIDNHHLYYSGRGATKYLRSNIINVESTDSTTLTSFDSDGFSLGSYVIINETGGNHVAWNWLAGTTTGIAGSPSITPSAYSFNSTSGFSIISYTGNDTIGATIGHGLGVAPAVIIFKNRDSAVKWVVYHHKNTSAPETDHLQLNDSTATSDDDSILNDTAPSSSVITMKTSSSVNSASTNYIAYCFREVKGFSKFGSYVGNGSTPNFIYTGFKPAMVIFKSTGADNWCIMDNKRDSFNVMDKRLFPHLSNAESTGVSNVVDFVSNGFCLRTSDSSFNLNGQSFIYLSFAENPFVTSTGIPTTAR